MGKTLLSLPNQTQDVLPATEGGTGITNPGTAGNGLVSDGAGGWLSAPLPTQNAFQLDGGAANTNYSGTAKIDLGSSA